MKQSAKRCNKCGSDVLRLYSNINEKHCHECGHVMQWHLEPGQKPIVGPSRDRYIITGEIP